MIINTNGFNIGDNAWYVFKNCKYYVDCGNIQKIIITKLYDNKLNIVFEFPYNAWDVPLSQIFYTEQQAIDYCNKMNDN